VVQFFFQNGSVELPHVSRAHRDSQFRPSSLTDSCSQQFQYDETNFRAEPRDAYLSRVAAIGAGIPQETPAFNVNRLCGSGLQAIVSAAQTILLGEADIAIGAGAESMSRGPYVLPAARWGARLGDSPMVDYMNGILHDPFGAIHMGITAENVASRYGITRAMQDALAAESQRRAGKSIECPADYEFIGRFAVR
jgi:acetyl-CoA acetyltransferase